MSSEEQVIPQEPDRLAKKTLRWVAIASVATVLATLIVVRTWLTARPATTPATATEMEHVGLGIELRAEQEKKLHGYGYVDREKGVVHIPIERAIDLELAPLAPRSAP